MFKTCDPITEDIVVELFEYPPKKVNLIVSKVPTYFDSLLKKDVLSSETIIKEIFKSNEILESIEKNFKTKDSRYKLINYLFLNHLTNNEDNWEVYAREQEMIFYNPSQYSVVDTISKFLDPILDLDSNKSGELLFRGQENVDWDLIPSVFREKQIFSEGEFYYQAKLREPKEFNSQHTIDDIVKMQHYFLPTRLLDLSYNPLVSLYFACLDSDKYIKNHGVVYIFNEYVSNAYESNGIALLSSCVKIRKQWSTEEEFISSLIEVNYKNNPDLDKDIVKNSIETSYFINASNHNERIKRQQGAFVIFGMDFSNDDCLCEDISKKVKKGFIIPREAKKKMLKSLEVLGISEAFIYPELEHQAKYIKQKYKKNGYYKGFGDNGENNAQSQKLSQQEMQTFYTESFFNKIKEISLYYGFDDFLISDNEEIKELTNLADWYTKETIKSNIKSIFNRALAKTSIDPYKQNAAKVALAMFFMEIDE